MTLYVEYGWHPLYEATLWWCGDEVCDCYQPTITLLTPNVTAGRPWFRRTRLWAGTFHSGPSSDEYSEMRAELKAERARRGLPEGVTVADDVPWSRVLEIDAEQMASARTAR